MFYYLSSELQRTRLSYGLFIVGLISSSELSDSRVDSINLDFLLAKLIASFKFFFYFFSVIVAECLNLLLLLPGGAKSRSYV